VLLLLLLLLLGQERVSIASATPPSQVGGVPASPTFWVLQHAHTQYKKKFSHHIVSNALLMGFPLELGNTGWPLETRMMELPGRERSLTTSLAVWTQYNTIVTDRHTDTRQLLLPRLNWARVTHLIVRSEWI